MQRLGRKFRTIRSSARTFANPWAISQARLRISPSRDVVVKVRNGPRLVVPATQVDLQVVRDMFQFRHWEPSGGFIPQNDWTVLDLGAHMGVFSVATAWGRPNVRVWSVEPSPMNYAYLERNIALNQLANVTPLQKAIAEQRGTATLQLSAESWSHTLMGDPASNVVGGSAVVDTLTLADLCTAVGRPVDLMKMDIEGMEYGVLTSAAIETMRTVRRIMLEYHTVGNMSAEDIGDALESVLESRGFRSGRDRTLRLIFAQRTLTL